MILVYRYDTPFLLGRLNSQTHRFTIVVTGKVDIPVACRIRRCECGIGNRKLLLIEDESPSSTVLPYTFHSYPEGGVETCISYRFSTRFDEGVWNPGLKVDQLLLEVEVVPDPEWKNVGVSAGDFALSLDETRVITYIEGTWCLLL